MGLVTLPVDPNADDLRTVYLQTGPEARGATVLRLSVPAGAGPSLHLHTRMEESFYVLEGEFSFQVEGHEQCGGPGAFVFIPAQRAHAFRNLGNGVGRLLCICSPPGHEGYFRELDALRGRGIEISAEELGSLRARYDTVQL
jgi:mannose-6-phosphate isomerase-like protein (cupin superfamily)